MKVALALASRGLGFVWPNPAVGCVIVKDGHILGRGWTQPGGRPHAETEALRRAGPDARGATAYVSFEPCAHHGETPPCAEALVQAGVERVVIACPDPDPRVAGRGVAILKEAGIEVAEDVLKPEAERLNRGFLRRIADRRPMVTVKVAASLDGRVATSTGDSKWITGKQARRLGHLLRAGHDGIAVGSGTVAADNPALTCRLPGMANWSPVRIVFSGSGGVAMTSRLVRSARETPTWIVMAQGKADVPRGEMEAAGVHVIEVGDGSAPGLNIKAALSELAELGLTRLLVEGGPRLATAFLRAGAVDRLAWFAAPRLLGGDALAAVAELGVDQVAGSLDLEPVDTVHAGADMLRLFDVVGRSAGEV